MGKKLKVLRALANLTFNKMSVVLANGTLVKSLKNGWIHPSDLSLNDQLQCLQWDEKEKKWNVSHLKIREIKTYISCYMNWFDKMAYDGASLAIFKEDGKLIDINDRDIYYAESNLKKNEGFYVMGESLQKIHPENHIGEHKLWGEVVSITFRSDSHGFLLINDDPEIDGLYLLNITGT